MIVTQKSGILLSVKRFGLLVWYPCKHVNWAVVSVDDRATRECRLRGELMSVKLCSSHFKFVAISLFRFVLRFHIDFCKIHSSSFALLWSQNHISNLRSSVKIWVPLSFTHAGGSLGVLSLIKAGLLISLGLWVGVQRCRRRPHLEITSWGKLPRLT